MSSAIDLSAHSSEITATHQRILNKDPSVDWALYGFERGGSNVLAVHAQGSSGLEELAEEFDDGKVQFAFVRVEDPNTRLPKFVFISWCGRGVPVFRKGMVASQVGEVQRVLTGYHVSIVARSEEDVQASEIMDQVARSSGAQYSYHTQPKRQAPALAAKPAFAAGTAFRKGGSYGAPSVTKGPAWSAAAVSAAAAAAPTAYGGAKPSGPKPPSSPLAPSSSKPLFGGNSGSSPAGGRPVSSLFGARSPTTPAARASPTPVSPAPEPTRTAPQQPSYKSQQDETRAELEALRRGSRAQSPSTPVSRESVTPTSRLGAAAPAEPSAHLSQADQTKSELEMLRSRKQINSGMNSPSGTGGSNLAASERKAELEVLRRSRAELQWSPQVSQPAPPVHPWKQQQDDGEEEERRRQQQQEEEDRRRKQQQEEEERKRQQQQDEERRRQQQIREQEEEKLARHQASSAAAAATPEPASSQGQRARAVYDYEATAEDELEFNEGDTIYNVELLDPGWWAGETKDGSRRGVFPANFVELIEDEPQPQRPAPAAAAPPALPVLPPAPPVLPPLPPAPPSPPPAAPALPPRGGGVPQAPPLPPPSLPAASPPAPPPLPPTSAPPAPPPLPPMPPTASAAPASLPPVPPPLPPVSQAPPALPPRGNGGGPAPAAPPPPPPPPAPAPAMDEGEHQAVAVFDYDAAEDGELSFGDGERITHVEFPSDEWWGGVNQRGEYGLFPANYVELVRK
ncbi:actin binding protein [Coemansia sp. RSA 1813]|nr:actin binding protein [Coemansia sp. RSA 1646]KAJ1766153.1 actin binding protein [Coemansia sp. RSA 1843]KAJ2086975.1 actin binding protein [Coemansia sp. RSA 986]KAJ2211787.1 actin binding protein [Coemansia sp. RSA 487]KAJ2562954.1 actin binding protein [Coemansia sp. RSA 1813]